jgi:hypothetical protein
LRGWIRITSLKSRQHTVFFDLKIRQAAVYGASGSLDRGDGLAVILDGRFHFAKFGVRQPSIIVASPFLVAADRSLKRE